MRSARKAEAARANAKRLRTRLAKQQPDVGRTVVESTAAAEVDRRRQVVDAATAAVTGGTKPVPEFEPPSAAIPAATGAGFKPAKLCTRHRKLKTAPGPQCSTACQKEWEA